MLGNKGMIRIKSEVKHTRILFGDELQMAGHMLQVDDWSVDAKPGEGDALAIFNGHLVDVDRRDIEEYFPPREDPISQVLGQFMQGRKS